MSMINLLLNQFRYCPLLNFCIKIITSSIASLDWI